MTADARDERDDALAVTEAEILAALDDDCSPGVGADFTRLIADYFAVAARGEGAVSTALSNDALAARFDEPLPRRTRALDEVVARLRDEVLADANRLVHPMAMGHQVSAPLPAAVWSEALIGALNQSLAVSEMSPTITALETRVVQWMRELLGFGDDAGGTLTSGGTEATFAALLAARNAALPDAWMNGVGVHPPVIVCGEHAHYAIARAAGELGIGVRNIVTIPSRRYRMNVGALDAELDRLAERGRRVMAVVATAGSTATGAFDDLEAIGRSCERRGLWLHVDGAHGASALLSPRHRHRLRGIARARSVAWDPHKMMLLPLSAGVVIVRHERELERAFAQQAPYLFHGGAHARTWDQGVRSFQCSRRGDALKVWVALQRYGADGIGRLYERLCDAAATLHALIEARGDFEAMHEPECNILCFRYVGDHRVGGAALDQLNRDLRERYNRGGEGWITTTVLDGIRVLRVAIMNPRTSEAHLRRLLDGLAACARG